MKKYFSALCVVLLVVAIGDMVVFYFVGFPTEATGHLWLCVLLANIGALFFPLRELVRESAAKRKTEPAPHPSHSHCR